MSKTNPNSINYRDENLGDDGRAAARKHINTEALKASTGQAGLDQGNAAKAATQKSAAK